MKVSETGIEGLLVIEPRVFEDERGYFFESYNSKVASSLGITSNFVQDNESYSTYGTLRGLHFQTGEAAQAKLVRVVKGVVLDVAVDLRPESKTFKKHYAVELSENNRLQFFIPRGFAHGFVVLSRDAIFQYKCDNFYNPSMESGLAYNDPSLNIDWRVPQNELIISPKDLKNKTLKELNL